MSSARAAPPSLTFNPQCSLATRSGQNSQNSPQINVLPPYPTITVRAQPRCHPCYHRLSSAWQSPIPNPNFADRLGHTFAPGGIATLPADVLSHADHLLEKVILHNSRLVARATENLNSFTLAQP